MNNYPPITLHPSNGIRLMQILLPLVSKGLGQYTESTFCPVMVRAIPNVREDGILFDRLCNTGLLHLFAWVSHNPLSETEARVWLAHNTPRDRQFGDQMHQDNQLTYHLYPGAKRYDFFPVNEEHPQVYQQIADLIVSFMVNGEQPAGEEMILQHSLPGYGKPRMGLRGDDLDDYFENHVLPSIIAMVSMEELAKDAQETLERELRWRDKARESRKPAAVFYPNFADNVPMPDGLEFDFKF